MNASDLLTGAAARLTAQRRSAENAGVFRLAALAALFVALWVSAWTAPAASSNTSIPVASGVVGHPLPDDGGGPAWLSARETDLPLPGRGFAGAAATAACAHHPGGSLPAHPPRLPASPPRPVPVLRHLPLLI